MANFDESRKNQVGEAMRLIGRDKTMMVAAMSRQMAEGIVIGRAAGLLEAADVAREACIAGSGGTPAEARTCEALAKLETALQARAQLALDGQG